MIRYFRGLRLGRRRRRRGAAVVEFAVILPLLLLLLFGVIEFGWVFMIRQTLTNAAREGVRVAVLQTSTAADVENRVREVMNSTGYAENVDWFMTASPITDEIQWVRVRMPIDKVMITGGYVMKGGYDLTGVSSMRKEGGAAAGP